jgi:hypothetical protein
MKMLLASLALLGAAAVLGVVAALDVLRDDGPHLVTMSEHSYGTGPDQVWVFKPEGRKPRALVLFVHGAGDDREDTPYYHRPWIRHLVVRGNVVVYPRYEPFPGGQRVLAHLLAGARLGARHAPSGLPSVAIGYSRGGRLVMEYAALARGVPPVPKAILSVFPAGAMDPLHDLGTMAEGTRVVILAGDQDEVVGTIGASQLVTQLAASGFPYGDLRFEAVRSHGDFAATHLSVLEDSPGARAAFWSRADRLIAGLAGP